jgi:hypothetical protein
VRPLPGWFQSAILKAWEKPYPAAHQPPPGIRKSLGRLPAALRDRWPDPVVATVHTRAPWDDTPRRRYQLLYYGVLARNYVSARRQLAAPAADWLPAVAGANR